MKKILSLLFALSLCLLVSFDARAEKVSGTLYFKEQMHRIFDSYNNAWISISLEKLDIADIYMKEMLDAVAEAKKNAPEKDHARIVDTFVKLEGVVKELRGAMKRGDRLTTKMYSMDMFNGCVTCHKESKLEVLFKKPRSKTLFAEYMHKVSDHLDRAGVAEEFKSSEEVNKQIKLVLYYLDLLASVFPDAGPSGVIIDRKAFDDRIAAVRKGVAGESDKKKHADIEGARTALNSLCVACHEPERIR